VHSRRADLIRGPHTCAALPAPTLAAEALSGFALSQAISSLASFTGNAFFPTINIGANVSSDTGSKSLSKSYDVR
jgi:hypothetical protein